MTMSRSRDVMDQDRFAALAAAYGGELRRWPAAERAAAQARVAADPRAAAVLDEGRGLDAALDDWRTAHPSHTLRQAVL